MNAYRYYAEIDLDALEHNVKEIRRQIGPERKLCLVIKANGYGHGAVELAHFYETHGFADWFAVSSVDEGLELRRAGINRPILVLGTTFPQQYEAAIAHEITLAMYDYESACILDACAKSLGKTARIHIKLDTGMSRIGYAVCEASAQEILKIHALPHIYIEGMFTHFACADMEGTDKTNKQIERYQWMFERLAQEGVHIEIRHCANSAGIMEYKDIHMDMVRAGIIIYGLYPSEEISHDSLELHPVMSLHSHVAYVKDMPAGVAVSYGGTYVTPEPVKMATIPVGYADGYFRSLSNKGSVLIHGQRAPICGRVCMDQFMVDVTAIEGVKMGDPVVLIGCDGADNLSAEEVSGLAGSFNYEIVCEVSRRVPRVYTYHGQVVGEENYLEY